MSHWSGGRNPNNGFFWQCQPLAVGVTTSVHGSIQVQRAETVPGVVMGPSPAMALCKSANIKYSASCCL